MKFGVVGLGSAEGAILAHSVAAGALRLRKGRVLSAQDLASLADAGVLEVVVARLEHGDVPEDAAAEHLADGLAGAGVSVDAPFTGRVNLYASLAGLVSVDRDAVAAFNDVDEAITLATLPDHARVAARTMIGTVKVIPYAVPATTLATARAILSAPPLAVHPFRPLRTRLLLTRTPGLKPTLIAKAENAVRARLDRLGLVLDAVETVAHQTEALAEAIVRAKDVELLLIFGASATSDRKDVAPAALEAAGGRVTRFGMPVDPGNLLFLGTLGPVPVIGLPGCARSPALNGADWVLERIAAGMEVRPEDIAGMGVGGLLKEIPTRPQPRGVATVAGRPRVEVLLLAAGGSTRMGGRDKLMEEVGGVPLLRRMVSRAVASRADAVRVMLPETSPRHDAVAGSGAVPVVVSNPQEGMAASIRAGLASRSTGTAAVIVMLADMPEVTAGDIDRLIAAFDPSAGREIVRATDADGTPGHPILFGARFFETLSRLEGDRGARDLLREAAEFRVEVALPGKAATTDLDTPEAWAAWRAAQGF